MLAVALCADTATVRFDNSFDNRQSQPTAARVFLLGVPIAIKNMRQRFRRNTRTRIAHSKDNRIFLLCGLYRYISFFRCEFNGIFPAAVGQGADDVPYLAPYFGSAPSHGMRVFIAEYRTIAVVVNLDQFFPPKQKHGEFILHYHTYGGAQSARPGFNRTERGPRPIHRARQCAYLTAAGERVF